jgi:predicted RNA-binding Zn-ribbon protein involved in translation (DUF1610 family)
VREDHRAEATVLLGSSQPIELIAGLLATLEAGSKPIPMRMPCPGCGDLHIDEGEFATKPHHTHACQECGLVWRPACVCTVGVKFLPGYKNEAP